MEVGEIIPFPAWMIPFPVLKINFKFLGNNEEYFVKEVFFLGGLQVATKLERAKGLPVSE